MAGKFRLTVGKNNIRFGTVDIDMYSAGDYVEQEAQINYVDGTGQTVSAGQVLYSEGIQGNYDYFVIKSKNNHTFTSSGFIEVIVGIQFDIPAGSSQGFNVVILNSDAFSFTIHGL